jgi:hypothetical protein
MHYQRITGLKASLVTTVCILLLMSISQHAYSKNIMCWKNKQKIRECGGNVPPEYAQQRIEVLNEQGIVIKIIHARKSEAQLAREAREAEHQKTKDERRRQDMILLKTFTKEQDLLSTRDKQLAAIDSTISIASGNLRVLHTNLAQLQKQAANHERGGTSIPKVLLKDIESVKKQISENEKYLEEKELRKNAIKKKFAADLVRYRKLKKVKPR